MVIICYYMNRSNESEKCDQSVLLSLRLGTSTLCPAACVAGGPVLKGHPPVTPRPLYCRKIVCRLTAGLLLDLFDLSAFEKKFFSVVDFAGATTFIESIIVLPCL